MPVFDCHRRFQGWHGNGIQMKILREIDIHLHDRLDVVSSCRKAGISDKTYYHWRKKFGGMGRSAAFRDACSS